MKPLRQFQIVGKQTRIIFKKGKFDRFSKNLFIIASILFFSYANAQVIATYNVTAAGSGFGCDNGAVGTGDQTPMWSVNMTGHPSGTSQVNVIIPPEKYGECCGLGSNNNCLVLAITLDPGAAGITFTLAGASGSTDIRYMNCASTSVSAGTPLCVSGVGPHYFMFCRTGTTDYTINVTSIPTPTGAANVSVTEGCNITLTIAGLNPNTVYWNSTSPGTTGQWNNLLTGGSQAGQSGIPYGVPTFTPGPTSVTVTPIPNSSPSTVTYQVCGNVLLPAGCLGYSATLVCFSSTVSIYPNLFANAGPDVAMCQGGAVTATGTAIGGTPPYNYTWSDNATSTVYFSATNVSTTIQNVTFNVPGNYTLTITDATGCPVATDQLTVSSFVFVPTANAGADVNVCRSPTPTVSLTGTVTQTGTGIWSGGAGTYTDNNSDLPLSYTPSAAELAAGSVTLTLTPTNTLNCPYVTDQVVITLPSFTSYLLATPTNITCFGLTNGSVNLTVTPGSPSYATSAFSWSNSATTEDISGLATGTYTVTVTDVNGCTVAASMTLTQPAAALSSSILGTNVLCYGNSTGVGDLTVSGGTTAYGYLWSNGATTEDISDVPAGSYSVTVTDANSCTVTASTTLTQPQTIISQTQVTSDYNGEDISCIGASDGSVTVTVSGGAPNYQFEWINAQGIVVNTSQSPTGLPSGDYSVAIEDQNGCLDTNIVTLLDPPPISLSIVVSSDYNGEDISCNGFSDGFIDFTTYGVTAPFTYIWRDENGQIVSVIEDPTGLSAGTYQVIIVDNNGCVVDTSITLTEPQPLSGMATVITDYNGSDISCYQLSDGGVTSNILGGTPGYTYTWSNSSGASIGYAQSLSGIPAGTYTVSATDLNGCVYSTNVTVNQPSQVTATSSVLSFYFGQGVSCEGASDGIVNAVAVGGTPTYSYIWNSVPLQATQMATGLPSGTYTVAISDINGCTSTSSVVLTANPMPQAVLPLPINGCVGGGALINANAGEGENCTWTFSDGQVFNQCGPFVANFDVVDCYGVQLTVISTEGCTATTSASNFVCIHPNPFASFYADDYQIDNIETNAYFWNTSIGASSYYWYYGDGSTYDTTFNAYHEFINGSDFNITNYQVTLCAVSEYGCIDSVSHFITMTPELIIYVPNTFTPDGDKLNNTFLPILTAGYNVDGYDFMIFNRWGELIFESKTVGEGWDGSYRGKKCQDGVYTWKLNVRKSYTDEIKEYVGHVSLLRGGRP
jgi:gliding motility-associated-like protein